MERHFCIFSAMYDPHVGGVENYTRCLSRELAAMGHKMTIVADNTEKCHERETTPYAQVFRLPCADVMGGRYPVARNDALAKRLWSEIGSLDFDYVIVNTRFYQLSQDGVRFAQQRGIVPVVIEHGSAHLTAGNKLFDVGVRAVEHLMTNRLKRYDARYWGVSAKAVEWLGHFGLQGQGVLCNAIDAPAFRNSASQRNFRNEFDVPDNAFLVAFTGRISPEKGIVQLSEAARMLDCRHVHVIAAGDGPLREKLAQHASANMHFTGPLSPQDISALLQSCDAFCMPTRSEGFSTSLLEAAACGLAPVITQVGGVDELVPSSRYGIVLPDSEPATIEEALCKLASDRASCRMMAAMAQSRVETQFTWKNTATQCVRACEGAQRHQ